MNITTSGFIGWLIITIILFWGVKPHHYTRNGNGSLLAWSFTIMYIIVSLLTLFD